MLHILLLIFKIIGITLLVLISLVLVLLLSVLFVPVRYGIRGTKEEKNIEGYFGLSWFLGVFRIRGTYAEQSFSYKIRLFGIDLQKLFHNLKKKKKGKKKRITGQTTKSSKKDAQSHMDEKKAEPVSVEEKSKKEQIEKTVTISEEKAYEEKNKNKIVQIIRDNLRRLIKLPGKIVKAVRNFVLTIHNICDKISYLKELWAQETTQKAVSLIKEHLKKSLKHILPKKIKGNLSFGFEDPCTTGQVLAGISIFYPYYYKTVQVTPDFTKSVLEGSISCKGRIYGFFVLKTALCIYFDKNIQSIIEKIQNKEAS